MRSPEARVLRLGTRKSLLAWSQSQWVAHEIEGRNPGVRVELVGIETRGDRIQDVPLSQLNGKEFFVAEIDAALSSGEVDLTVHSMKDLSLDRPSAFVTAAVPPRENPRDVVLFGPGAREKIAQGRVLRIGTSSPRRLENIPPFLERALPTVRGQKPRIEFVEIRGNVNTRLSRVHLPPGDPKQLDAVVLAFAGLIRMHRGAAEESASLFDGIRWMVLPLRQAPAAPAQGALAVECRAADASAREIIAKIHHPETARQVTRERALLAEWGGGCHQRFGATCVSAPGLAAAASAGVEAADLLYVRGARPDGIFVDELRRERPPRTGARPARPWDGSAHPQPAVALDLSPAEAARRAAWFIAHSRALPERADWEEAAQAARVWTSGASSWFRLAERGIWVEGCTESLGFEAAGPMLREATLALPSFSNWAVLTHRSAIPGWDDFGTVAATYALDRVTGASSDPTVRDLATATHAYWASGSQFEAWGSAAARGCVHACGPGKTAAELIARGVQPLIFVSAEEWREWVATI